MRGCTPGKFDEPRVANLLDVHSMLEQLCRDRGRGLLDAEHLRNLRRANEESAGAVVRGQRVSRLCGHYFYTGQKIEPRRKGGATVPAVRGNRDTLVAGA